MRRYLVTTFRAPRLQASVADEHRAFIERLREQGKLELAGSFHDKSGCAYIIRAGSLQEAQALAYLDPVHVTKSSVLRVFEWLEH